MAGVVSRTQSWREKEIAPTPHPTSARAALSSRPGSGKVSGGVSRSYRGPLANDSANRLGV